MKNLLVYRPEGMLDGLLRRQPHVKAHLNRLECRGVNVVVSAIDFEAEAVRRPL